MTSKHYVGHNHVIPSLRKEECWLKQAEFFGFGDDAGRVAGIELLQKSHPVPFDGLLGEAQAVCNDFTG